MKFEFVDFYPLADEIKEKMKKNVVGTVHIYAIDCQLDIRGILVSSYANGMYFNIPNFVGFDPDSGKKIRYPVIGWTQKETHQEMMDFLHKEVKPIIKSRLKAKCEE